MAKKILSLVAAAGWMLALAAGLAFGQEAFRVKVLTVDAVIHAKPEASSPALDRPAVGAQLEVVRRTGEWFEVRFRSRLGMVLIGYIHRNMVEAPPEEQAAAPAPAVKPPLKPAPKPDAPPAAKPVSEPDAKPSRPWPGGRKVLQIGIGGFVSRTQVGDSRTDSVPYRDEALTIGDSLGDAGLMGLDFRIGFMPLALLEVELGFQSSSQTLTGTYEIGVPSLFFYNDVASDDIDEDIPFKSSILTLGVVLHPLNRGPVRPYLGFGAAFCSGSLKAIKNFRATETYYSDYSHTLTIEQIDFEPVSLKTTGFAAKVGIDAAVAPVFFLFAEAQYVGARKSYELPLATDINNNKAVNRTAELGGVRGVFGLRIRI